jgi:predicted nucleotidyltransferase
MSHIAIEIARQLYEEKFSNADCFLLCGSTVRGDATKFSDLDIVIVYKKLEEARRESFVFNEWPVEIFVHDFETLNYFFEKVDGASNCPSLPQMVREGVIISEENILSKEVKSLAEKFFSKGPNKPTDLELLNLRYGITDLIDDVREPKNNFELISTGTRLFEVLSEFIFKTNNSYSGKGKWISRRIKEIDSDIHSRFFNAFEQLFVNKDSSEVISFCENYLAKHGGFLFDGHRLDAPSEWRLPVN